MLAVTERAWQEIKAGPFLGDTEPPDSQLWPEDSLTALLNFPRLNPTFPPSLLHPVQLHSGRMASAVSSGSSPSPHTDIFSNKHV